MEFRIEEVSNNGIVILKLDRYHTKFVKKVLAYSEIEKWIKEEQINELNQRIEMHEACVALKIYEEKAKKDHILKEIVKLKEQIDKLKLV